MQTPTPTSQRGYGSRAAQAIQVALRTIRVGNLVGNTVDAALRRISGRLLAATDDSNAA